MPETRPDPIELNCPIGSDVRQCLSLVMKLRVYAPPKNNGGIGIALETAKWSQQRGLELTPLFRKADLETLLTAAGAHPDLSQYEHCGAWPMRHEDDASTAEIEGCWWSGTLRHDDRASCFGQWRGYSLPK